MQGLFTDTFKKHDILSLKDCDKQGEVTVLQDKQIGKRVVKVTGNLSTSNCLRVPSRRSKPLNLKGDYIIVIMCAPLGSVFSFHLDFEIIGVNQAKLSFSNIYRNVKILSSKAIQIPLSELEGKWSVLCIDAKSYLTELVLFAQKPVPTSEEAVTSKTKKVIARPSDLKFDFTLSSYELCSKALYRSVFISDVPFNPKTLPKEMKLILNKNEEFEHRYVYRLLTNQSFIIPTQTVTEEDPTGGLIRGRNLAASEQLEQQKRQESKFMSALKPSNADDLDGEIPQSFVPMATPNIQQDNRSPNPRLGSSQPFRNSEVDKRQTDLEDDMQGKVLFKTQNDVKIGQKLFELEPTPIMSLYNRQGVDTVNGEIAFSTDSTGVVISNKNLICTNIVNNYQRFLIGHDRTVACFSVVHNDNLLISADTGDPCEVIIWRIVPARIVCRFKIDMKLVHAVDVCKFTRDDSTLIHAVFVGIDAMDRDLIMVYDVTEYSMNNCKLFTKQISDFHIKRLRYLDHSNPNILVSCGKDNICFWQVKNKFLTIQPVNLNEHSYNNFFHAIDVLKQKMIVEKKPSGAHGEKAFNSGDQVADAKGSRNCYFVYVVSSLGFMYLIDYNLGEMKTVLRLHSAAINCIKISHNHNFIVTGGADNFVRIWSIDSSELLFDFKLDSQVSGLAINNEDLILLSTLSGSVGTIDIQNKMFKGMVRSHSDKIIDMDYNKTKRILMTLSLDRTLRLWDCKNKTSQIYEFQCLDEQPLCLCSYSLNHYVLVGFRGGLVRLFDIHNYIFVKEFTEAQADIVKIRVSADDQFFVTADASGTLIIYDGQGEYRRTILVEYEPDNFILDLDYYCQSLLCTKSPFSLLLFSTNSWEIKQKISLNEEIETARFSYLKDRVIVLTKKGKLKFYLASYHEIVFLKDFGCLHDGGVKDFESSLNCAYILTIGKVDNTIKVWDYNFRGNLVPAYQSFSLNENSTLLKLSNDDQGLVFTANDCNINTWMFKGSFEDMKLKAHSEEIEKREKQLLQLEESATSGVLNRRAIASSIDPLDMGVKPKGLYNQEGHIVGELAQGQSEAERMLKEMEDIQNKVKNGSLGSPDPSGRGQPGSKSVRFKDNLVEVDEEKLKRDKDFIELEYLASKMAGRDNKPETSSEIDRASAARTNQTKLTSGSAEPNPKQDYEKFTHECLKTAHVLGTNPMVRHSVKWDTENEYYSLICSNKVLINYFDEEESQKSLDSVFIGNASILAISSKSKYLVVGVDASNSEPSAGFSVYDCRTLFRMHSSRLNSAEKILICEISKKEDYLMLVYKPFDTEYSYVQVWDILNNKAILESAINEPLLTGLWNPFGIHYSEFVTISKDKVFFWRMSRNNTLQYQAITVNDLGGKIDKDYTAVTYFELSDQFKTCLVIVGTSHGGILLIDSRSAVVVAYINSLINESIQLIEANDGVINISGTTPNIYSYFANENTRRSITDFVKIFESSPQIMSLDGKIGSLHFPAHFKGMEGLATTSAGSLWYLNWKDRLTLRLKSWHCHQRKVLAFDYNADKKKCFTSAADFTVKIWNDNSCEEEVELFVPNKGCLCMASRKDTLICGFTDGTVRFYELIENTELGSLMIAPCAVTAVRFLRTDLNILVGNIKGDVYMLRVETHSPLRVQLVKLVESMDRIWDVKVAAFESLSTWGMACQGRLFKVWKRKDIYRVMNDMEEEEKMKQIRELEYYLIDNYTITLNTREEKKSYLEFSSIEPYTMLIYTDNSLEILFRNYKEHMNIRTIKLSDFPTCVKVSYFEDLVIIGTQLGRIDIYDYFSPVLKDYQIVHSSEVLAIDLVNEFKEDRLSSNLIYAGDIDDPRNKTKFLNYIYSMSKEDLVKSKFYRKFDRPEDKK